MSRRLPPIPGEWIDRHQPVSFTFEGSRYTGYQGDVISSALWAAGQQVLGRSFKYHRPRGILSGANHDVNSLLQRGQQLSVRADVTPIEPEMILDAVNTMGGVAGDRTSVLDAFSSFLPVGFYYKAFYGKRWFRQWESLFRRIGGLGRLDPTTPHIRTPKQYDFCDVAVIGGGPSGLSAALAAAEAGAQVVLVDENPHLGGSGCYQLGGDRQQAMQTHVLVDAVQSHGRIRCYLNTQAAGYYADHWIPLVEPHRITKLRAKSVVVASGAFEQPAVFRNNDLPGVMLASAAQRLIYRYAVKPMQRAVVFTANLDGYRAALDLVAHGVEVVAIADLRPNPNLGDLERAIAQHDIPIFPGHCVYETQTSPATDGITHAILCPIENGVPTASASQRMHCDGLVMSVGWAPAANLLYQAGTQMVFDESVQQFVPKRLPDGVFACGRANGVYDVDAKCQDGKRAGYEAATYLGFTVAAHRPAPVVAADTEIRPDSVGTHRPAPVVAADTGIHTDSVGAHSCAPLPALSSIDDPPSHPWPIVPHPKDKNFVDFDEDLQLKDFYHAAQEGFDNIELLKRYSTVGMGPSQGKHSNMNALRILARINGQSPGHVGTTTARPFFHPVPLSHLAGRGFSPVRHTPMHDRHALCGATFMRTGQWLRPAYYQHNTLSPTACIQAEALAVRSGVGLIDVGTLGKLELRGPDAVTFLEQVYTGKFQRLKVGKTRYGVMVDETGVVIDDGVIARLGPEHFYFTTTSSGAAAVYRELTRLKTLWNLDCGLVNLTGARAAVNVAGPRSQIILSKLTETDLSATAFPYLAVQSMMVAGIAATVMRVGFVGEWGYEIHVAADYGAALWDALMAAGAAENIRPFGVEAQRLLRLEKGHIIVGQDTDGLTTPFDAAMGWAVKMDKPFFIGQRSLKVFAGRSPKQVLVGFKLPPNATQPLPQECNLVIDDGEIAGRVTSIAHSPTLGHGIGLAYVKPHQSDIGTPLAIRLSNGEMIAATVCNTPFYDPENLRQKPESSALHEEVMA
ncbi:MAG: FAD-dependent oxidoreductase [Cyanobacteria bacterium P01_E01_bin.6]